MYIPTPAKKNIFPNDSKSFPNDSLISNSMYVHTAKKGKRMRKMAQMGQFVMHSIGYFQNSSKN